ncbi:MAG: regulatory protein RecX [Bacteroidetes bacterium]|nr:regulatory protein RecX [Bacteroidota bacterium]MDA0903589.1 regulatory protein RecX [Bacteroidota bacterium]MDA1242104.1 regulatory protein RecX [Bacteroidota bacterium]
MEFHPQFESQTLVARMQKWCSLRDRSRQEAQAKLESMLSENAEIGGTNRSKADWVEEVLIGLERSDFLDDRRCAESYVRAHHVQKRWGPLKIREGLRSRGISQSLSEAALSEVPTTEWLESAVELLRRRQPELTTHRERTLRWLLSRGFPSSVVWQAVEEVLEA